jgi:hypothetical protein
METLEIQYSTWKSIVQGNSFAHCHVWVGGAGTEASHSAVKLYAGNRAFVFLSGVQSTDETDWDTNFESTSSEMPSADDALATLIGTPTVYPSQSEAGLGVQSVLNVPVAATNLEKSWEMTVSSETTGILDIWVGGDLVGPTGICYLEGGEYRCRTDAAQGSALHFALVDRDDVYGLFSTYGLSLTKLDTLTNKASWPPAVGETVTGGTSGTTATVLAVNANDVEITYNEGPFTDGEALTFSGGATATLGTWEEGDVLELTRSVKDEWVEGKEERKVAPGGAKLLPAGLYFRVICYNNHTADDLRVKITLILAKE